MTKRFIVTGGAGFIGSNLCDFLLRRGYNITCIDNFDDYYSPVIKQLNISEAIKNSNYNLIESDIQDINFIQSKLKGNFDAIIHLAAKAGVRYSIENPTGYEESNVKGTRKILELAVNNNIKKFIFSSSSSIYGDATTPFSEDYTNLKPLNPYAQTKLASEKIGLSFSKDYNINFIALRFFSVYGPRLRPDLVMNKIAKSIFNNEKLTIFGDGSAARDYTYIDDIIQGIIKSLEYKNNGFEIFNIGNGKPISLNNIINLFEQESGKKINKHYTNSIKGESDITWANNIKSKNKLKFKPETQIQEGIKNFLEWYKNQNLK